MAGFTDALVLEAPALWWPDLGELPRYPVDDARSFMAAVADAAMPWSPLPPPPTRTAGLSRLGRSVFISAEWSADTPSHRPCLRVNDPLSSTAVYLPVSTEVGLGAAARARRTRETTGSAAAAAAGALTSLDLSELVRDGRVRLTPRSTAALLRRCCPSPASLHARVRRCAERREEYALLHRAVAHAHAAALKHLQRVARLAQVGGGAAPRLSSPAPLPSSSSSSSSVLFTGDTPSQQQLLRLLLDVTPAVVQAADAQAFATEVRHLRLSEVLALTPSEALEVVEAVLRPPPLSPHSAPDRAAPAAPERVVRVSPCVLLVLEALHLLEANVDSMGTCVAHHLCICLDVLHAGPVPAVVWSFAEDVHTMPAALRVRVGAQQVRLAGTAAEDRAAYVVRRLARAAPSQPPRVRHACAAAIAESTAHWPVDRLVRLPDVEVAAMAAALDVTQPPVGDVYGGLYGVDDAVRQLEELIVWPLTHLPLLRDLRVPCAKGVLVCGPSGSGKTTLLRCLGRRLRRPDARQLTVMAVDGLTLLDKEVGRSEKNIVQLFATARAAAPTALFIDNIDSLAPPRGRTTAEANATSDRTLSTLLTQMDGVAGGPAERVVVVVASAPSPGTLDPAVRRPGRLDVHVRLTLPPASAAAAFMRDRLRELIARLLQRDGVAAAPPAALLLEAQLDACVDAIVARRAGAAGERGVTLSPAEATAAVREVTLAVLEELARRRGDASGADFNSSAAVDGGAAVVSAVHDVVQRLHTGA